MLRALLIKLKNWALEFILDNDNESVGKKIRQSELQKVPLSIVIGQKIDSGEVTPRVRQDLGASGRYNSSINTNELLNCIVGRFNKQALE